MNGEAHPIALREEGWLLRLAYQNEAVEGLY